MVKLCNTAAQPGTRQLTKLSTPIKQRHKSTGLFTSFPPGPKLPACVLDRVDCEVDLAGKGTGSVMQETLHQKNTAHKQSMSSPHKCNKQSAADQSHAFNLTTAVCQEGSKAQAVWHCLIVLLAIQQGTAPCRTQGISVSPDD